MIGLPTTFWGKLAQREDGTIEWHPLEDHCCDVAAVAEALLHLPLWRRRIARSAGLADLDRCQVARLCVLAALHDLGKFTLSFQAKGRDDLDLAPLGHVGPAVAALRSDPVVRGLLGPLGCFGDGTEGLLVTAFAHHGRPTPEQTADHQRARWQARAGLDPIAGVRALVVQCQRWFPEAFDGTSELPDEAAFEHGFAGLVMLADWIGSDTAFFPYRVGPGDRMETARRKAADVLRAMAIDVPAEARSDSAGRCPFERISPFSPRPAQRALGELDLADEGTITVQEAETGSGKTEAALAHFVRLFESGAVDGLYFALPTRTAATQIFERVREAAARAFSSPPPVVLAVPGYLRVDDAEGQRSLPDFDVLWPDSERFRYRGWAAEMPKRFLAGAIAVGTIDQVLLSSLAVGHAHLRATSLLRHLLVVDEVHASDAYMATILEDVLDRHLAAGGHALLLSATLACEARARLLRPGKTVDPMTLEAASAVPYPLISTRQSTVAVAHDGRDRDVSLSALAEMDGFTVVASRACQAAAARAKVLVLRNTVRDCIATQLAVEAAVGDRALLFGCAGVPAPHHGRFAREDRRSLDEALEAQAGREARPGGCVVVATQTVQQSLDLDFDLVFTDLSPVDVLLQRLGRLHRHPRPRPPGFEEPRAFVLVPSDRNLASLVRSDGSARSHHGLGGAVYPDLRMLEAAWRLLERWAVWHIPSMNRAIVEAGLHSEALEEIVESIGEPFRRHSNHLSGTVYGHRRLAELNLVNRTTPYHRMAFPGREDERIATRLGEGDRRLRFEPGFAGPFDNRVEEITVPAFWARGAESEEEPSDLRVGGGAAHFTFANRRFVYDRLGFRPEAENPQEADDNAGP